MILGTTGSERHGYVGIIREGSTPRAEPSTIEDGLGVPAKELDCANCIMNKAGNLCPTVAGAIIKAVVRSDNLFQPNENVSPEVEAGILRHSIKSGAVAEHAAQVACAEQIALHKQTSAENPLSVMI